MRPKMAKMRPKMGKGFFITSQMPSKMHISNHLVSLLCLVA